MSDKCPEQLRLGKEVARTITAVYRAKEDFEYAAKYAYVDTPKLTVVLVAARASARTAQHKLDKHVAEHHCG